MEIDQLLVGWGQANCYIIYKPGQEDCVIIDPGGDGDRIYDHLIKKGLKSGYILCTHGHADHIAALGTFLDFPIYIHNDEAAYLISPNLNLSELLPGERITGPPADHLVVDGQKLTMAGFVIQCMHTPGHTPGGVCYRIDNHLFSGDTLFAGSVGRTDLPGGNTVSLTRSLKRLMKLPKEVTVYPGHGFQTNIGREHVENPFCNW